MNNLEFISRLFLDYKLIHKAFGEAKIKSFFKCYWDITINNIVARIEGNIEDSHSNNVKLWSVYGNDSNAVTLISEAIARVV